MGRKLIGVICANPEAIYEQRILDGIFSQCDKYGYNVAVFSPLTQVCHFHTEFLKGELNIFELINFDQLDGIIVATISLVEDQVTFVRDYICEKLENECTKPVVSLDLPLGNYPVICTDDRTAFSNITAHILDVHKCSSDKIYMLTGMENYTVAENRLKGFADELEKRSLPFIKENIFYGDFWYTSGEQLAERIASGDVPMPQAVICASDHMAIGLANKLISLGIKVPEQVIITGYDATAEAAINFPTITSYIPDISKSVGDAVNYLRSLIEPDAEIIPSQNTANNGIRLCASCGCPENMQYVKDRLHNSLYTVNHNYGSEDIKNTVDISRLLDSYMYENFTGSESVSDCMWKVYGSEYLIRPYSHFYLCLTENWLDNDFRMVHGYPRQMNMVMHTLPINEYDTSDGSQHMILEPENMFDTDLMLPQLYEESEKACVFYFAPVHFIDNTLGYSVLQCELTQKHKIDCVFRNWLRNVNNALEMMRIRNRLLAFSERDAMTGMYNRRGMKAQLEKLRENAKSTDSYIVFVIDMDGLKYINDNFGHSEGDFGIRAIASAAGTICTNTEIGVRAGGDEFYIIGIGEYSQVDAMVRIQKFNIAIAEENKAAGKPYEISASIGYCCEPMSSGIDIEDAIQIADGRMYENKTARKKQRK